MKLTILNDSVGRVVIGEKIAEDAASITLQNPTIINIIPQPQHKQLQVQLIPFIFSEFLDAKERNTSWTFSKTSTVICTQGEVDVKLVEQYKKVFSNSPIIAPERNTPIVKLFDV